MAQIRKGFIAANAIDGTKLKLLNNEAIRAAQADGTDAELMKLDSSNVLQFLRVPQVSVDPTSGNDVARKSYVDASISSAQGTLEASIASEQSAREAADDDLQDQIDTEKGRIDAILLAADADKDSFAEIVQLINSVDTTNDQAFAAYVLSNDAALADEVSNRQSADTTLQNSIDAEANARSAADSAEQSAREAADAALQAAIDALTVDDMTDVATSSKADGDLMQWDSGDGQWKNVAPLSEYSSTLVSGGSTVSLFKQGQGYGSYELPGEGSAYSSYSSWGYSYFVYFTADASSDKLNKISLYHKRLAGNTNTGTVKLALSTSINRYSNPAVLAYSAEVPMSSIPDSNSSMAYVDFSFEAADFSLVPGTTYYAHYIFSNPTTVLLEWQLFGNAGEGVQAGWERQDGSTSTAYNATSGKVYTGTAAAPVETPDVGVIKTNADGMLDDSFLGYDVNFGGHKLQGVSAPTSGTDAANKTYVDGEVASEASARASAISSETSARQAAISAEQSARESADTALQNNIDAEVSARQSAVSAEQSARETADQNLQDQIDALDSGSTAGLAQEISDRQAADDALDARLDVLEGSDSTEGSVAKAEKDAKDYADSIMATEQSSRQAADSDLQDAIDAEKARIDAILLASDADKDSFAEIVQLINSVDTTNDNAFAAYVLSNDAALAQEVSDRQAAVSAEQSARETADDAMDARLDVLEGSDSTEGSVAKAEKDAKDHADSIVASEQAAREAADLAEQTAREAADDALDGRLDVLEGSDTTEGSVAKAEKDAKDYADSLNATESAARSAADDTLQDNIDAEAGARSAADTTLQGNIDSEASARQAADSAEQSAREAADTALQNNIDAEQAAREAAVSAEQSAREAADSALDTRVDALEGIQHRKEKFTLTSTDISNGYVDLSMEVITDSEMVFVGALYFHSTDHYTVSTVGGVTRLTWTGPVAVGGASELVAGDTVYVRYMK